MLSYIDYLKTVDASHPMTTDVKHIKMLCDLVVNKNYNVLELGSYLGISAAAIALASPQSSIISVDLSDRIPVSQRNTYWKSLGITNITGISDSAMNFIKRSATYDFIFHDAIHGNSAMFEYLLCAQKTNILGIHDFEQLNEENRNTLKNLFAKTLVDFDNKGRCLFIGFKEQNS